MASTRAAAPLRSVLRIALARPSSIVPVRANSVVSSGYPAVRHTRSFRTVGVRLEESARADGSTEPKKWDFDMVKEVSETKPKNLLLIDVREPNELKSTGTIPTSVNVPITTHPNAFHLSPEQFYELFGFEKPLTEGPNAPELVFYCKAGVRGRAAAQLAKDAGYKSVGDYAGSWLDWAEKGGKAEEYEGRGEVWENQ